ncbi:protein kinase domain-containing protein [Actinomadura monticuli]|uniref:non-specific serine/threonine protein kinase n=1 Tax=Actinomadura monticuli TaxID=3097367 RepID=A0ABV4QDF3_9ACTN
MTEQLILAGRYRLETPLGRGGMGEVWRARDERLGRAVAVKLLLAPPGGDGRVDPAAAARFHREARIAAGLRHPGIAAVHDFGEDGGRLYLVIELVDGRDLNAVVRDHPGGLPHERASLLAARIAAALEAAHERGVVHRDIKPANVMADARDEITVLDFGIARYADAVTDLTGGAAIGTPAFMAPEQFGGRAQVDARADLYSLGALLHVLLTGAPPYAADSMPSLLHAIMTDPPPSVRERRPDVPEALDALVRELLAKDPADRPADAAEVIARLTGASARPRRGAATQVAAPPPEQAGAASTRPPNTKAPNTKAPNTKAPNTKAPNTKAPSTKAPSTKAPSTKAPSTKAPSTKAPSTKAPSTKAPSTKAPNTKAPSTGAPSSGRGGGRQALRRVAYGGAAVAAVVLANPGHLVFEGGAFDEAPQCRAMTPGDLAAVTPSIGGDGEARMCQWEVTQGQNKWTFTVRALRGTPGVLKSGPRRAADTVREAGERTGASGIALGDGGLVFGDEDTGRTFLFRVSNLVARLEVGLYGQEKPEIDPTARKIAEQLADRLRDLA